MRSFREKPPHPAGRPRIAQLSYENKIAKGDRVRLLSYLKGHGRAVLLIFILLIGQAFCELALPTYTSNIVDVGIMQSGIDHASPDVMRAESYASFRAGLSDADAASFETSYAQDEDGLYRITAAGEENRDALDSLYVTAYKQADDTSDTLAEQRAIAAAQEEYEACGVSTADMQMSYLLRVGGLMLLVTLGMVVCAILVGLIASRAGAEIARSLRERLFTKVVSFGATELDRFSTASLITRSTNDITQVQMVLIMLMRIVLYAPVVGIGGVIMVTTTNISMSWIIVLAVLLVAGLVATLFGITYPKFRIMQKLIDRVNLVSRESLTGVQVVRAFRREDVAEARFQDASSDLMKTQLFANRAMMFMFPGMMLVMNGASALIVWVAAGQIDLGAMQVGQMIAFITYAMVIIASFLMLSTIAIMLPRANVAAERIDEVLSTVPDIQDPTNPVDLKKAAGESAAVDAPGSHDVASGAGSVDAGNAAAGTTQAGVAVEFDQVEFHYGDAEQPVLQDISFTAQPGQTTAIIGGTGSGKSTLLNLIPRFYDATAGAVRVAGVDVRDARQADLRELIGYVPQKSSLFSGTIESNLKYAGSQVSDEDMREAARVAQAEGFILQDEDGYARPVAQGGSNVSGGQRQRLAIARALAKRAPILLFDDSFSALDYRTDHALRAGLREHAANATVIIVAQRVATIMHADQIIVLDGGRIVGKGSHEELLANCDVYREIAQSQLSPDELAGKGVVR